MDLKDGCVVCGGYVSEGSWVCLDCIHKYNPSMTNKANKKDTTYKEYREALVQGVRKT